MRDGRSTRGHTGAAGGRSRRCGLSRGALDGLLVENASAVLADLLLDLVRDARPLHEHVNALGDVLVSEGKIVDVYEKESKGKTMTFLVSETVWKDDKTGEPVLTERFNLIHRS